MPEIYEVKRISAYLRQAGIEGKKIQSVQFHRGGAKIFDRAESDQLNSCQILRVVTKAKYTFFELDRGVMIWHYRMSGLPKVVGQSYRGQLEAIFHLPIDDQDGPNPKFRRLTFVCDQDLTIDFLDQRCLSVISLDPRCQKAEQTSQYERLATDFSQDAMPCYATWIAQCGRKPLKLELQNQSTPPSGIGNYLACEILAYAGLNPWQIAKTVTKRQYDQLIFGMRQVRKLCERHVGYHWFRVFSRPTCRSCAGAVLRVKSGSGQSTHFCPQCQPSP